MSRSTFDLIRIPLAVLLIAVVVFVLWPRGGDAELSTASPSPSASVIVGEVGGAIILSSPSVAPSVASAPPATAAPTPVPTAAPTPVPSEPPPPPPDVPPPPPAQADGFTAVIRACRTISGQTCNEQLGTLASDAPTFTALVTFTNANAGDLLNAILSGPSGTIAGAGYPLQGSGDGYYYSQFQAGGLAPGSYTLTATRNGTAVAVTSFQIAG